MLEGVDVAVVVGVVNDTLEGLFKRCCLQFLIGLALGNHLRLAHVVARLEDAVDVLLSGQTLTSLCVNTISS